jgi:hypothetical protein
MFSVKYNLFVAWVPSGKVARRLGVKYVFFGLLKGLSKGPLDPLKTPERVLYSRVEYFLRFTRPYGSIDTYCWNLAQTTPKVSGASGQNKKKQHMRFTPFDMPGCAMVFCNKKRGASFVSFPRNETTRVSVLKALGRDDAYIAH